MIRITKLVTSGAVLPLGLDTIPAFGWTFASAAKRGQRQTAYRILVSSDEKKLNAGIFDMWDSGNRESRKCANIVYEGAPLASNTRYYWKVQIWDERAQRFDSETSFWETGFLHAGDWKADWLGAHHDETDDQKQLPIFRHEFVLQKPVARARAYVCGLGHYEFRCNGDKVGDYVLAPGWTEYDRTCFYNVLDVTDHLHQGPNVIGIMLGNGFFNVEGGRYIKFIDSYGKAKCLVQLEIDFDDGTSLTVCSNQNWKVHKGPLTFSCIYGGEDYDARLEQHGWDRPGFPTAADWANASEVDPPEGKLKSQMNPPLKVMKRFRPVQIEQVQLGIYVADFGQNFSGWVQIKVKGREGAKLTLTPAERLKDGRIDQRPSGSPHTYSYIAKGSGEEEWSPRFSYYGFRYVQIEGATPEGWDSGEEDAAALTYLEGQMIYPDVETGGSFACSDAMINRIHGLINWAMLSNMKSYFTDCPHREKLGWLEQLYLMGPSLTCNYSLESLLAKILNDMKDAQQPNGLVPTTAPEYVVFSGQWGFFRDAVAWGGAYILVGQQMLQKYGNVEILREHYENMRRYIDYVTDQADGYIVKNGLGDWYDVGPNGPGLTQNTPTELAETAIYYHIVTVFQQFAELLNHESDAAKYAALGERIKAAFNRAFFNEDSGLYASGSQTAQAMPLALGLAEEPFRMQVFQHLADDVVSRGCHTTAGDVGHRYVLQTLQEFGRSDLILAMARRTESPSYGYQIVHGATALTEAWDGPTVGHSQNHFMLGHIEEWFYRGLAGIEYAYKPDTEDFEICFHPLKADGVTWVESEHELPPGRTRTSFKQLRSGLLEIEIEVPTNTCGMIYLPLREDSIQESGNSLHKSPEIERIGVAGDCIVLRVPSGQYTFTGRTSGNAYEMEGSV